MTRVIGLSWEEGRLMARVQLICIMVLVFAFAADGRSAVDFSGVWKMDATRSESAHQAVPIGPVTLVIKQTATELSIETQRSEPNKSPSREVLIYQLDATESSATATDGTPIKCRAHWEDDKLVTGTTRNIQGATVTTLYVHSLADSGKELSIRKTLTVQHGYQFEGAKSYGSGTDVFLKVKAASAR